MDWLPPPNPHALAVLLLDIALIPALIAGGIAFLATWWVVARWADPESIARVRAVIGR